MADHPRGRHGGVLYDPGQFGIEVDQLRSAMRPYVERFGITEER